MRIEVWLGIATELLWVISVVDFLKRFFVEALRSTQVGTAGKCDDRQCVPANLCHQH
jgi:hypothetical protein